MLLFCSKLPQLRVLLRLELLASYAPAKTQDIWPIVAHKIGVQIKVDSIYIHSAHIHM